MEVEIGNCYHTYQGTILSTSILRFLFVQFWFYVDYSACFGLVFFDFLYQIFFSSFKRERLTVHSLGSAFLEISIFHNFTTMHDTMFKSTRVSCEPIGGEITVSCESGLFDTVPKTAMEKLLAEQLKNSKFSKSAEKFKGRGCYYTTIPHMVKREGISGQELTSLNLDKTQLLETVLMKHYGGEEDLLLGELQFAFIAFLMGQSLEAFFQWKALVRLLFNCIEAPFCTRSHLFTKFIKVIYYQLKYGLQKDHDAGKGTSIFMDDSWLSKDSFLHRLCKDFFFLVQEASVVDGDLLLWTRKLKELLETTLGWEFQQSSAVDGFYDDDDEFAPVIEILDSSQERPAV